MEEYEFSESQREQQQLTQPGGTSTTEGGDSSRRDGDEPTTIGPHAGKEREGERERERERDEMGAQPMLHSQHEYRTIEDWEWQEKSPSIELLTNTDESWPVCVYIGTETGVWSLVWPWQSHNCVFPAIHIM